MLLNEGENEIITGLRQPAAALPTEAMRRWGNRQEETGSRSPVAGHRLWIDPFSLKTNLFTEGGKVIFRPYEMKILMTSHEK